MTLTDIFELQKEISQCKNPSDIQKLFDDNGEDCDIKTAELILNSTPKFTLSEQNDTFINSKLIFCPDCKNSLPDKILSSAVEIISMSDMIHFGCCECGTMWNIESKHHGKDSLYII